jgi:flagellar hook-basal body complex protein FliE
MEIESIGAITDSVVTTESRMTKPISEDNWIFDQLIAVDNKIKEAETQTQLLAVGEAENLHQVMISISKAKSSFELTAEIRNRLLESFQQVMRMQV